MLNTYIPASGTYSNQFFKYYDIVYHSNHCAKYHSLRIKDIQLQFKCVDNSTIRSGPELV